MQWEPAHEGNSCEAFAQWKIDNDPDAQEQGLAAHLQANGIGGSEQHYVRGPLQGICYSLFISVSLSARGMIFEHSNV